MASTNAPAGAENDKASKGESSGGRNLVLRAGSTASGAMPNSGKSIAESPPPTRRLSFSGMFRSASRESNQQMSPIANKLFSRNKRSKSRGPPRPGAGGRLPPRDVRQRAQTSAILLVASRRGAGLVAVSLRVRRSDTFGPASCCRRPGQRCIGASG
ncbi:uncharacterized protein LOC109527882 isoform X4 [Hippocampus comes]|uniref:uncharacterized protein LOC109527882 isoform X4 n=1 Tax=Hippocampus comes TaxID=109280 RepID=UPI00094E68A7|nr:PREDICTED: uncharacterized protein LOC109527882 isoform X4 [Hippocampus comes]